ELRVLATDGKAPALHQPAYGIHDVVDQLAYGPSDAKLPGSPTYQLTPGRAQRLHDSGFAFQLRQRREASFHRFPVQSRLPGHDSRNVPPILRPVRERLQHDEIFRRDRPGDHSGQERVVRCAVDDLRLEWETSECDIDWNARVAAEEQDAIARRECYRVG